MRKNIIIIYNNNTITKNNTNGLRLKSIGVENKSDFLNHEIKNQSFYEHIKISE